MRFYVLRDGALAGHRRRGEFDARTLAQLIAGHEVAAPLPARTTKDGLPKLEVRGLSRPGEFSDVSFKLCAGEILGFTGLQGSGRWLLPGPCSERRRQRQGRSS